jgi:hypothetical protein
MSSPTALLLNFHGPKRHGRLSWLFVAGESQLLAIFARNARRCRRFFLSNPWKSSRRQRTGFGSYSASAMNGADAVRSGPRDSPLSFASLGKRLLVFSSLLQCRSGLEARPLGSGWAKTRQD